MASNSWPSPNFSGISISGITNPVNVAQYGTWNLNNIVGTISLPTGAATSANQSTEITALGTINTTLGSPFQAGGSIGNTAFGATQSGTWNITDISGTVSLPTGAATSAKQDTIITALGSPFQAGGSIGNTAFGATQSGTWNINNVSGTVSLPTGAATSAKQDTIITDLGTINTTLGSPFQAGGSIGNTTFASTQSGTWNINNISGTISLPTLAATSTKQSDGSQKTQVVDGSGNVIGSQTINSKIGVYDVALGFGKANAPVYNSYSSTNITTSAYVQLVASLSATCQEIEIFDSSGQALYLAVGAAASEVDQMVIIPGGNGRVKLSIAAGSRVSAKAITGTANSGFLTISFYG